MSKFCHNCGLALNDGDVFCPSCGTKLYDTHDLVVIQQQAQQQQMVNVQIPVQYVQYDLSPYKPDVSIRQMFLQWHGRLNRKRYFMRVLMLHLIMMPLMLLGAVLPAKMGMIASIVLFLFLIPLAMLSVRRCHDLGRSGWFMLKTAVPILGAMFCLHYFFSDHDDYDIPVLNSAFWVILIGMPFVGMLIWIYLMFASGDKGPNEYGADPLGSQAEVILPENKVLQFLYKMESPGENRGILGLVVVVVLITVVPGMLGSLSSGRKNTATVAQAPYKQSVAQSQATDKSVDNEAKQSANSKLPPPSMIPQPPQPPVDAAKTIDKKTVNNGANPSQRAAIDVLYKFHDNITNKEWQRAYNCLGPNIRSKVAYEGWMMGFQTTVSSKVYDVKVAFENSNCIVLTYYLQAVDNPGGTKNYNGTVSMIKNGNEWKIEEITNKLQ